MDKAKTKEPINFIYHIINKDVKNNTYAQIYTRFPPEPNGYLHIGHAKSICLNFALARDYLGKCNLRFDDTNPIKEENTYINAIKNDISWLGFMWDKLCYSSDYFDKFYQYALELINKGLAYVCFLSAEQIRSYRGTLTKSGKNSPYRNISASKNLTLFKKMRSGDFKEGECVLRAKIDMHSSNMSLRDPTLYRIRFERHHQTANKWCIYPMYDFAHPISDAIEGISHSLCTLEFADNRQLYEWLLTNLDDFNHPQRPRQYEFSRLNLAWTLMSKRKLEQLVDNGFVSGWNDPRMPTISGLRRRGYTPSAIIDFANRIGISKINSLTDIGLLESCIRDDLNLSAPRTMAVINPLKVVIKNYTSEELETLLAPIHPQNVGMGKRKLFFGKTIYIDRADFVENAPNSKYKRLSLNKEVRLRNAYIIKAISCDKDKDGNITTIYANYDKNTLGKAPADSRKVDGVIHFVEASTALKAKFMLYDRLFKKAMPNIKLLSQDINPNSLIIKKGFIEPNMVNAKPEQTYQFEREGYFCRDSQSVKSLVFNKTVGLRDVWQNKP